MLDSSAWSYSVPKWFVVFSLIVFSNCSPALHALVAQPRLRPEGTALRVMTFNIQSGLRGLDKVAEAIRFAQPDLVALQEVDNRTTRSNGKDQAAELSKLTGLPYHRHFAATQYYGGDYGIAVLSRIPFEDVKVISLPTWAGLEPRVMARLIMHVAGSDLSVYLTHLSPLPTVAALRAQQARAILAVMAQNPNPKLLLGDLNEDLGGEGVKALATHLQNAFALSGKGEAGTYPLPFFLPALQLDHVFASAHWKPMAAEVIHTDASDHYPLISDLELVSAATKINSETAAAEKPIGSP